MKTISPQVKRRLPSYLNEYKRGASIKDLAKKANYPPYLFARYIVEQVADLNKGRKGLTQAMRDPLGELGSLDVIAEEYLEAESAMPEKDR